MADIALSNPLIRSKCIILHVNYFEFNPINAIRLNLERSFYTYILIIPPLYVVQDSYDVISYICLSVLSLLEDKLRLLRTYVYCTYGLYLTISINVRK